MSATGSIRNTKHRGDDRGDRPCPFVPLLPTVDRRGLRGESFMYRKIFIVRV